MAKDHRCAKPGCQIEVPGYALACYAHWMELPAPLRTQIVHAWRRRRMHPDNDAAAGLHLELVVEAISVWSAA